MKKASFLLAVMILAVASAANAYTLSFDYSDVLGLPSSPVAGAIVFAASANVISGIHPVLALAAGVLVAGTVHVAKAGALRPAVTATTGGAGNIPVSIAEDIVATVMSFVAIVLPVLIGTFLIVVAAFIVFWLYKRANRNVTPG